ncbi:MAG: hypothetical protein J6Y33_08525 [Prevotella sp.]|nr:hypothetical protein [Prevotella sp.]
MRKTYQMMIALVALLLSAASVSAGERIPLTAEGFYSYEGYGLDAVQGNPFDAAYIIGEPSGCPFGDSNCEARVDLGSYAKLYVNMEGCDADGNPNGSNPRIFINRTEYNGQFNATKESSKCIVIPNEGTWANEYYTVEDDGTYVIDLLKIAKEFGFVHLHAVKGSAYNTQAIINSIEVEKAGKAQQIGWINLINNSDMEGDDVSSFFTRIYPENSIPGPNSEIVDGAGVNDSRGIVISTVDKVTNPWDCQFFFRFNEPLKPGDKYRVSFDYRADQSAGADTQAHNEPGDYIYYDLWGKVQFEPEWQTFTKEGEVTDQLYGPSQTAQAYGFLSVAFNLNDDSHPTANNYYFDNIKFEVFKAGIVAEYGSDVVLIDFGFNTNIADLVAASGMPRLLYPTDCASVVADGEPLEITTVEAFSDGRFYIFTEEPIDGKEVIVTLKNPTAPAYHIIYTNGPGGDVPFFQEAAEENEAIAYVEDAYSFIYLKPTVLTTDPEDGSFNLPNDIREFKIFLDKEANCAKIKATMGKEILTVSPAEGFAKEITLKRTGAGELATGTYTVNVTNIFCQLPLDDSDFTTYEFSFNAGKVSSDPNDVPKELLAVDEYAETGANSIPAGFYVTFQEEERTAEGGGYGSGPRMFDFGAGGDFTKGLYFREGYVQYGSLEGYPLTLEEGKKYNIRFNTAQWKDNGTTCRFEILNEYEERVFVQMISNTPNMNGGTGAVNGSTRTEIAFTPESTGNYLVRWTATNSEDGDPGYLEVLLGNPSVMYIPNVAGVEVTQLLNNALASAKTTLAENEDERYAGSAYNDLDAAIKKYEAEAPDYTAPSKFKTAAATLDAATQALKNHHLNCDNYDSQMRKVIDAVRQNGEGKFVATDLYKELVTINDKYHGSSEWVLYDPEDPDLGGEFAYTFDKLTDDAALQAAVDELSGVAQAAVYMFTEGASTTSSDVGIKVLVDRIRQGAEGLKQLGVAEDDEIIAAANNAVSDDDELAERLKNRLKLEYYNKMKNNEDIFGTIVDEETLEETPISYNFTVFVKNPNTYCWKGSAGVTEENCPGWTMVEGTAGLTDMWNGSYVGDIDGLPKDLCITQYHAANRIEQTITDLPAGVYNVMIDCAEWSDEFTVSDTDDEETAAQKEANHEQNRVYVKTSDTPEFFEGEEEQFAADARIDHYGQYVGRHENLLTDVEVTDGYLTIGVKWNNLAQMMFDRVQLFLVNSTNFDYAKGYEEVLTGVDAQQQVAKVRAIELFDLNGQRIPVAKKGIVIVKKHMSDGTIRTQKIVK